MPLWSLLNRYRRDQSGASSIEYGVLAAMMTVVVVGVFATGEAAQGVYNALLEIADAIADAVGGGSGDDGG